MCLAGEWTRDGATSTLLDVKTELPEPWGAELAPKGIHSYRDFGAAADISPETARRLCTRGSTSSPTVQKVADALFDGDATKVWALYGKPLQDFGPWELPPEARLLDDEQRAAVLAVVRGMLPAEARRKGGDGNAEDSRGSAPTNVRELKPYEVDEAAYNPEKKP